MNDKDKTLDIEKIGIYIISCLHAYIDEIKLGNNSTGFHAFFMPAFNEMIKIYLTDPHLVTMESVLAHKDMIEKLLIKEKNNV